MKLIIDRCDMEHLREDLVLDEAYSAMGRLDVVTGSAQTDICVLTITHRFGTDVHASTSEGRLMEFLAEFCRQYWGGERARLNVEWLPQEAPEDDVALIQQYFCMARGESWDIHTLIEIE